MTPSVARTTAYVALLRGVNVGGTKRIAMAKLRAVLAALGFADVRTYLQSGNAVFRSALSGPHVAETLAACIRERIARDVGLEVDVLVVSAAELAGIVAGNPFAPSADADIRPLHVTLTFAPVAEPVFSALTLPAADGEEVGWSERAVYLRLPHGYGRTRLNNGYFERALGTAATTRNWRTMLALAEMVAESE